VRDFCNATPLLRVPGSDALLCEVTLLCQSSEKIGRRHLQPLRQGDPDRCIEHDGKAKGSHRQIIAAQTMRRRSPERSTAS